MNRGSVAFMALHDLKPPNFIYKLIEFFKVILMKVIPTTPKRFGKMSIGFICSATLSVVKEKGTSKELVTPVVKELVTPL